MSCVRGDDNTVGEGCETGSVNFLILTGIYTNVDIHLVFIAIYCHCLLELSLGVMAIKVFFF